MTRRQQPLWEDKDSPQAIHGQAEPKRAPAPAPAPQRTPARRAPTPQPQPAPQPQQRTGRPIPYAVVTPPTPAPRSAPAAPAEPPFDWRALPPATPTPEGSLAGRPGVILAKRLKIVEETDVQIPVLPIQTVEHAEIVARLVLHDRAYEAFLMLYLNAQRKMIGYELLTEGSRKQVTVDTRSIARNMLLSGCDAVVTAHNHPGSTSVTPSNADLSLWSSLERYGKLFNITIFDHLIIGDTMYYSNRVGAARPIP